MVIHLHVFATDRFLPAGPQPNMQIKPPAGHTITWNSSRMPTALQKAWLWWCKQPHVHRRTPCCAMSIAPMHCHSHPAAPVAQEVVSVPVHLLAAPPAPPAHLRVALSSNNTSTLGCLKQYQPHPWSERLSWHWGNRTFLHHLLQKQMHDLAHPGAVGFWEATSYSQVCPRVPKSGRQAGRHQTCSPGCGKPDLSISQCHQPDPPKAMKILGPHLCPSPPALAFWGQVTTTTSWSWAQQLFYFDVSKWKQPFLSTVKIFAEFLSTILKAAVPSHYFKFPSLSMQMISHWRQNIWRTLADISACKRVWGAFIHLFAWKKDGFNWLSSRSFFRRHYQNTGQEPQRIALKEPEQIFAVGTDLMYQIRPACYSPSHCHAISISLRCFILQGAGGKGPLSKRTIWEPGHKRLLPV